FTLVTTPGAFVDKKIPHRFAPFGCSDASRPRAPSTHPGAWRSLPHTSALPAAICWSGTSGTGRSTLTSNARTAIGSSMARSRAPTARRSKLDGLSGLAFGNGTASGPTNTLYFTSGPGEESQGLFGSITPRRNSGRRDGTHGRELSQGRFALRPCAPDGER